ncbi:MAG TPA: hypothetical protein VKZ50_02815 [bacterium]|nr:hypothetical protein [bacterium]
MTEKRDVGGLAYSPRSFVFLTETFFINPRGRIVGKFLGELLDASAGRRAVEALLADRRLVP